MSFIISIEASDLFLCFYVTKNITAFYMLSLSLVMCS